MESVRDQIARLSNASFPEEACGLVLADGGVVALANVAEDPVNNFSVDPVGLAAWWETGQVTGVWHSHPMAPAVPSEEDESGFNLRDWDFLIYSVCDEDLGWYRLEDGRLQLTRMEGTT